MEPPQQDFCTPTEESEATQESQSPERVVEETLEIQQSVAKSESVVLSESPRPAAEPPEEAQQIVDDQKPPQSPIAEVSEPIETEEHPPQEPAEEDRRCSFGAVEKPIWLQEPTNSPDQLLEQLKHVELNSSLASAKPQEPEKYLIPETPVEIQPEEGLEEEATVTETVREPASEEQDTG